MIDRLVITGVGLIGGSFALALKSRGLVKHVTGVGRSRANLERALALGLIDVIADDPAATSAAYSQAGFIFVATPVGQMARVFADIAPHLKDGAVVTDGGSTKSDVAVLARAAFGPRLAQFVPAHPIAGAELTGADAAKANLYEGKKLVMAPLPETAPGAILRVQQAWEACGARVFTMSPELHDKTFAAVSHLPHVLAFALVDEIARKPHADVLFQYAASGFRDFTRIAGSSPEMWRDISIANRTSLLIEIDEYAARLQAVRTMIDTSDAAALDAVFTNARSARQAWLDAIEIPKLPARDA